MSSQKFTHRLQESGLGFSDDQITALSLFRDLVIEENEKQNLTRIIEPEAFLEGHVLDGYHLKESGLVEYRALDVGSGAGVPGLVCAILGTGPWTVCDSEKKKAEFLRSAVQKLGLKVDVAADRAENYLKTNPVEAVVARAVGPVVRIYGWIQNCSTWNTLVLMKGRGWEEEWEAFSKSPFRNDLKIAETYRYEVGAEKKARVIVRLERIRRNVVRPRK